MTKVVMIQSISGQNNTLIYSYGAGNVVDLPDATADDYVTKGFAIYFTGWETNPKRPPVIRFPQ